MRAEPAKTASRLPRRPLSYCRKANASATLLAYVATAKYQDALPLYRQSQIFARHGAEIPRNTLARWMVQAGERIAPLIETLRRHLLRSLLIHMDETTLQVNQEADRKASANLLHVGAARGAARPTGGLVRL